MTVKGAGYHVSTASLNTQHNISNAGKALKGELHRLTVRKQVLDHRMRGFCGCDRMPNQDQCVYKTIKY